MKFDRPDVIQMPVQREDAPLQLVIPDLNFIVVAPGNEERLRAVEAGAGVGLFTLGVAPSSTAPGSQPLSPALTMLEAISSGRGAARGRAARGKVGRAGSAAADTTSAAAAKHGRHRLLICATRAQTCRN